MAHQPFDSVEDELNQLFLSAAWLAYWPLRALVVVIHVPIAVTCILFQLGISIPLSNSCLSPYPPSGPDAVAWRSVVLGYSLACFVPFRLYTAGHPTRAFGVAIASFVVARFLGVQPFLERLFTGFVGGELGWNDFLRTALLHVLPGMLVLYRGALVQEYKRVASARGRRTGGLWRQERRAVSASYAGKPAN